MADHIQNLAAGAAPIERARPRCGLFKADRSASSCGPFVFLGLSASAKPLYHQFSFFHEPSAISPIFSGARIKRSCAPGAEVIGIASKHGFWGIFGVNFHRADGDIGGARRLSAIERKTRSSPGSSNPHPGIPSRTAVFWATLRPKYAPRHAATGRFREKVLRIWLDCRLDEPDSSLDADIRKRHGKFPRRCVRDRPSRSKKAINVSSGGSDHPRSGPGLI